MVISRNLRLVIASLLAALTAVSAYLIIPIGPVPITMQTCFVLLSGAVLGSRWGAGSQIVYISLGLIGLPVFTNGFIGPGVFLSPTFGYILGFVPASFITGLYLEYFRRNGVLQIMVGMLLGQFVIWMCGLIYLYLHLNTSLGIETTWRTVLAIGFFPFIPFDVVKIAIATSIRKTLARYQLLEPN